MGSIIIIGGGVAGLSAGCYGQMNGYETRIFEMHDKPGGLCTSWKRKGFTIDGCIHWLVGSRAGSDFNQVWMELGALQDREIVDHREFVRVEGDGGKALVIYTNADRLEQHMKELSPADSAVIEELTGGIRNLSRMEMPLDRPESLQDAIDMVLMIARTLPLMRYFLRWRKQSVKGFAARFEDPFLRDAFSRLFDLPDFPLMGMVMTLAWMHAQDAGYPIGGSLEFSKAIEKRFLELGGEISYRSKVEEILVENDSAAGVRLADGNEHRADLVVSAADGHSTIFEMLEEKYIDERIRGYYATLPIFEPLIQVSLGLGRDLSEEPHSVIFPLERPVIIAGEVRDYMGAMHFCYDPTMAPEGKSVMVVTIPSNYGYWDLVHKDEKKYESEKREVADCVIEQLERRFGGISEQVEVVDVATPVTYARYTGNWKGSFEGWMLNSRTSKFMVKGMDKELPGLSDFYMAGHWVKPGGGLPPAALSGREVIRDICKKDGKRFTTSTPT